MTKAGRARGPEKRVRAEGRTPSSVRWLERQRRDPYVAEARRQGYRSRAAFKLKELDDRLHLLKPGARVVDLGAAPGGWTQVAAERTGAASSDKGRVVAVDLLPMDPIPGAVVIQGDVEAAGTGALIVAALGGPADVVLSDMAAPATGHASTDHLRTLALAEAAAALAVELLRPGGALLVKLFRGRDEGELLAAIKRDFTTVRWVKPPASRSESSEAYLVATGFRASLKR
jgi:23S rRNA (uridine2552-2'-O)-methyltransferase